MTVDVQLSKADYQLPKIYNCSSGVTILFIQTSFTHLLFCRDWSVIPFSRLIGSKKVVQKELTN